MTQFRKSVSITVGKPNETSALVISDLRITFDISKTGGKNPNTAKVEVFNLSKDTRKQLETLGLNLIIYAGYLDGEGEQLMFSGDISSITHKLIKPNYVTTIMANDGLNSLGSSKVSFAKGKGVKAGSILNTVLKTFALPNNFKTVPFVDKVYSNGFAFTGMSKEALTKLTDYLDMSWTIQNNEIRLTPFDGNDSSEVIFFNVESGLLGSPTRLKGEIRKAKGDTKKDKDGWQIKTLLAPRVNPKGQVAITSREIPEQTFFDVQSITHRGDTHGADFTSDIQVHDQ